MRLIKQMTNNQEGDIIRRVREGDVNAFAGLVDQYKDVVYSLCVRMLVNETDAEEAAQEVMIKAFRSLKFFQERAKFSTWLYRIAYNHCISVIRSKTRIIDLVEEFPEDSGESTDLNGIMSMTRDERKHYVEEAMESLAETDAVVMTLFYFDELSLEEIAQVTGLTNGNIRIRLHRARHKMASVLMEKLNTEIESFL
jgi:RNA polymerase sigma factor (sigma-70 family)